MKKDNSTFIEKVRLRQRALADCPAPVVCETHGGAGVLFRSCYDGLERGLVFERDGPRAAFLARQRPSWGVYETDCLGSIVGNLGAVFGCNFYDVDPYGSAVEIVRAILGQEKLPDRLHLVVNDGLRLKLKVSGAWKMDSIADLARRFGNRLGPIWLDVCKCIVVEAGRARGMKLEKWEGYYCGHAKQMTHYRAILSR